MLAATAAPATEISISDWVDNQMDAFAARLADVGCWISRQRSAGNKNGSTILSAITAPGVAPDFIFAERAPCNATSMQIWLRDSGVTIDICRRNELVSRKVIPHSELFTESLAKCFAEFVSAGQS